MSHKFDMAESMETMTGKDLRRISGGKGRTKEKTWG